MAKGAQRKAKIVFLLQTMINNAIAYNLALCEFYKSAKSNQERLQIQQLIHLAALDIQKLTSATINL